jgi:hypothetical protein
VDPIGIPVRAAPPGVVDEVDVGVEDEAMLLEPEPHIPVIPEVSSMPEVVDIPDVDGIVDDVEVPDIAEVAGAAAPGDIPPPSKLELDPNIDVGAVPTVEHAVLLGAEIVPVASAGAGLMPGDAISVDPRGMPAGPTVEPVPMPSGEVAPMTGVGLAIPVTCAMAALQTISAGKTTAINESLICILHLKASIARNHADRLDGESAGPAHGLQLNTHLCSLERTPSNDIGVRVTHPTRRDRRLIQWPKRLNAMRGSSYGSSAPGFPHRHRRFCDEILGRLSHFFESVRLDLPNAFTRHIEFGCEVFQRQWLVG